jgi:pimeloyl-ACP methyl ester carboxylesterase
VGRYDGVDHRHGSQALGSRGARGTRLPDGPLVLLRHGPPWSWYGWHHQLPFLAAGYRVWAPDYRGYYCSATPTGAVACTLETWPPTGRRARYAIMIRYHHMLKAHGTSRRAYRTPCPASIGLPTEQGITGLQPARASPEGAASGLRDAEHGRL